MAAKSKKCRFPKCKRPEAARGLCAGHYAQHYDNRPLTPLRAYKRRRARETGPIEIPAEAAS